jgi:hypothetical protein
MMRMPTDKNAIATQKIVGAAVSAALPQMQVVRLPPQTLPRREGADDFLEARIAA